MIEFANTIRNSFGPGTKLRYVEDQHSIRGDLRWWSDDPPLKPRVDGHGKG